MHRPRRLLACLLGMGVIGLALGCGKEAVSKSDGKPVEPQPVAAATGPQGLFDQHCAKCHAAGASAQAGGPKGKGKGPDLSHVGDEHDAAWIGEHITNPKAHKPGSRMPAFEGKLTPEETKSLADYLAAMK